MTTHMSNLRKATLSGALTMSLLGSAACSDLFTVENPGLIEDETLESPAAFTPLVNGIAGDFSNALAGSTGTARAIAELSFEMQTSGPTVEPWSIGIFEPASPALGGWWSQMHRARW